MGVPAARSEGCPVYRFLLPAAVLFLLVVFAYIPAMKAGFVWDDDLILAANPLIQGKDGLCRFWCTTQPPDYLPLTSSLLWVEWHLWGRSPAGYHVVGILLHALNSVLVWRQGKHRSVKLPCLPWAVFYACGRARASAGPPMVRHAAGGPSGTTGSGPFLAAAIRPARRRLPCACGPGRRVSRGLPGWGGGCRIPSGRSSACCAR